MWPESPWSSRKNCSNSQHRCRFFTSLQNGRLISKRSTLLGWDWSDSLNSLASIIILSLCYSDLFVPWALDLCLVNNTQATMHCPFCYYHFSLKLRLNIINTLHAESFMQEASLPLAVHLWFSKVCWSSGLWGLNAQSADCSWAASLSSQLLNHLLLLSAFPPWSPLKMRLAASRVVYWSV